MGVLRKITVISFLACRHFNILLGNEIKITKIGRITCIGLNRPQNKNSINMALLTSLKLAIDAFENDSSSFAGVLYGEQGNFSIGYDQKEINNDLPKVNLLLQKITESFCKKPLVAAINGFACGPGFELALWCDFRVVEETVVMAAFARNLGVPLSDESAKRLCLLLGFNRALDLVLTGRILKAKEAFDCGIATRIVACGTSLGQAVNLANSLANMPQASLKADRAALFSMSNHFTATSKTIICDERAKNLIAALKEVEEGANVTKSGDVRRKES